MFAEQCPRCGCPDSVNEDESGPRDFYGPTTCECEVCYARFEIDADADWTGDGWQDCSTPGREITEPKEAKP